MHTFPKSNWIADRVLLFRIVVIHHSSISRLLASLSEYFSRYGELSECMVMKDPVTNKSRGFGFLTFADSKNVDAVLKEDHHLDGKMVSWSFVLLIGILVCPSPKTTILSSVLLLFFFSILSDSFSTFFFAP